MAKYHVLTDHADTVYIGDKSIPVAHGDVVDIPDKEMENNTHLNLISQKDAKEEAAATKEVSK